MLSFTFALGSVHSFCCTSLLFIFTMNTSFTKFSVIAPKLHFEANPFNSFQNCLSDSPSFCFLDTNLSLSSVSFFGFSKHSLQFFSKSVRFTVAIFVVGNLSGIDFLPAAPNARYKTLMAFFIAGISSKSPIRLFSFTPSSLSAQILRYCFSMQLIVWTEAFKSEVELNELSKDNSYRSSA